MEPAKGFEPLDIHVGKMKKSCSSITVPVQFGWAGVSENGAERSGSGV